MVVGVSLLLGCGPKGPTKKGDSKGDNGQSNTNVPPPRPPKLEWSNGSPFVPTTELTTCQIGSLVVRIFLPDNRNLAPNRYYYAPILDLKYIKNGQPRPPEEMILESRNLNLNEACKRSICRARRRPENCVVELSPLPISFVQVGPQDGHPVKALYKGIWRKMFSMDQQFSGRYRVVLTRRNRTDTVRYCPLPMQVRYQHRAFKGSVAPQVVIDLRSIYNSNLYNRLSKKVRIGSGNTPTLVTPYQLQSLVTKQVSSLNHYTINAYDDRGNFSPFLREAGRVLTRGMENILDANNRLSMAKAARLSRELVSARDLQRFRDVVNRTVNRFNSATSSNDQRTILSQSESWDFFSVLAKGALEYLKLKDQPTKWKDHEWQKFVSTSRRTFNWERDARNSRVWRIRAINLMQLSSQSQIQSASVYTARFSLTGLSYVETTHAIDLPCKNIPRDRHCDSGERQGAGERCGADCGCCWNKTRLVTHNHNHVFKVCTHGLRSTCAVVSGVLCAPNNGIIYNRSGSIAYKNCSPRSHCGWSTHSNGRDYHADTTLIRGDKCFIWRRRWCRGRQVCEEYHVQYYINSPQTYRYCTPRPRR